MQVPETMGINVYSLLWVMQDSYHQPYGSGDLLHGFEGGNEGDSASRLKRGLAMPTLVLSS